MLNLDFKPDLFSNSIINWKEIDDNQKDVLSIVENFISPEYLKFKKKVEQHQGLENNSNNYRLKLKNDFVLLKKWSTGLNKQEIGQILKIMSWLSLKKMPVQSPKCFRNGELLINLGESYWSLFPFVEGIHFEGNKNEFNNVSKVIGILTSQLSKYPKNNLSKGPKYFEKKDNEILNLMENKLNFWSDIFGEQNSNILKKYWPKIIKIWIKLKNFHKSSGPIQAAHFDLHPHNFLMKEKKVVAVLDFESCKIMPVNYALAFSGLKLCKQAVIAHKNKNLAKNFGTRYINILSEFYPPTKSFSKYFYYFALAEVFRRLFIIFRLNLEKKENQWNKVLPIQLGHIDECEAIFPEF